VPNELEKHEFLVNRALDVLSASMMYLAVSMEGQHILIDLLSTAPATYPIKGRQRTHFLVDTSIIDSEKNLDLCVDLYHRAISTFGSDTNIKAQEISNGTRSCVEFRMSDC